MIFSPPDNDEFFSRGFVFYSLHDRDEGVISYLYTYEDETALTVTFELGLTSAVHVCIIQTDQILANITVENIAEVSFQSWHGSKILRMRFQGVCSNTDMRVHYHPQPSIHLTSLAS